MSFKNGKTHADPKEIGTSSPYLSGSVRPSTCVLEKEGPGLRFTKPFYQYYFTESYHNSFVF